jgi:hypothetical protein
MSQGENRLPSTKGKGEFIGRAYRRAYLDYRRTQKAGHTPGSLKAELIDSAEIQQPRTAKGFDCWIMLRGTTTAPGRHGGFYLHPGQDPSRPQSHGGVAGCHRAIVCGFHPSGLPEHHLLSLRMG